MPKVLYLISSLRYSGPARRMCLLARGLARAGFSVRVCVLETATPWVESLRQSGLDVVVLNWTRVIDVQPFRALRRLLKAERPDIVHAIGQTALRTVRACGRRGARLIASDLLRGGRSSRYWSLDRWLLRGADQIVAFGAADALRYRKLGVPAEQLVTLTPGVELGDVSGQAAGWPAGRVLLAIGPIEAHKGYRDAVWAFDILHYLFADLQLAILGNGPDASRVADFVHSIAATPWVHFLGEQEHIEPYLQRAAVVWVLSRSGGGVCAALEAMLAGRPVIATRVPEFEEIIHDGETGYLVPPGDKAALARQTRFLLGDEKLAWRLALAGQKWASEHHGSAHMVNEYAVVCQQLGG